MPFQEQYRDYFTTAVNRQESFLLCPSCASQGELFIPVWSHKHDSHDGLCLPWPDCTLSSSESLHLMNRPVTQSIATQQDIYDLVEPTVWSQRGFASHTWNFDRFHQSCLFRWNTALLPKDHISLRCGLSATYHCMPLFSEEMDGETLNKTIHFKMLNMREYDTQLTRRYHSIMLIHDWLHTGAFSSISPLHYKDDFACARALTF